MASLFNTVEEALHQVEQHEIQETVKFNQRCKPKHFGNTDPFAKRHKCMWSTEEMEYTGVPFRVVSEYNLECSRAMNRHKCKEGNEPRVRKEICSKKFGCEAKVKMKELIMFPQYKISTDTKYNRRKCRYKLMKDIEDTTKEVNWERKIVLNIPPITSHNHDVRTNAGSLQIMDKRISEKIRQEVLEGNDCKPKEMSAILKTYVRETLFPGVTPPEESNTRFFPSEKNIRNQMNSCRRKMRAAGVGDVSGSAGDRNGGGLTEFPLNTLLELLIGNDYVNNGVGEDTREATSVQQTNNIQPTKQLCRTLLNDILKISRDHMIDDVFADLLLIKHRVIDRLSKEGSCDTNGGNSLVDSGQDKGAIDKKRKKPQTSPVVRKKSCNSPT